MSDELLQRLLEKLETVERSVSQLESENRLLRAQNESAAMSSAEKMKTELEEKNALLGQVQQAYQEKSVQAENLSKQAKIELEFERLLTAHKVIDADMRKSVRRNLVDQPLNLDESGVVRYGDDQTLDAALVSFLNTPLGRKHRGGKSGSGPSVRGGRIRYGLGLSKRSADDKRTGSQRLRDVRTKR